MSTATPPITPLAPGRRAVVTALAASPLDAIAQLQLGPQPAPEPSSLAPDELVIAVRSAAVGWVDLLMTSGQYQHVPRPPYTPGLEFAGEVVAIGAAVDRALLGTQVIADGLLTGPRSLGEHRQYGGFASYAVAPSSAVIPLPRGLSLDEGACLLGGYETAYHALVQRARLQAGESLLVLGATGSTGLAAVQLGKLLGATVIAAGRSAAKLEVVQAQGADHVLRIGDDEGSLRERLKALTGGRGVDVVYDGVGGPLSAEALRGSAYGARFVIVGWAATPFVARGERDPNVLPTNLILMKGIDVLGSPAAIAVHRDPALRTERLARILAWANEGRLRPLVSQTFEFSDLAGALRAKWESRHPGNIVVHPEH
ncbi:MAG: NADPH:quinone oxidoreductase family protein [Nannocystis sp.]|nr:NADPH:quinone oxidoreductase family protein [Nannocystis sp.]MBA3549547.1 NADPH:quinone oxidoreductase family protein [Nannocystis sp.]